MRTLMTVLFGSLSLAAATNYPLTLTDDLGRKVTIPAEPQRIISVLPSNTEVLCAIDACSKLVGVDEYSHFPASVTKLPTVGGLYNPNVEKIVSLRPDLVIVSKYSKLTETLSGMGINVVAVHPESYNEMYQGFRTLGKIVNREANAKKLEIVTKREIAKTEILTKNAAKKPTVYFEVDPTPYAVGANSFMGVMITKAGGKNVIPASLGDFPKIDPELIVKANPQLILGVDRKTASARPGWSSIQAIKNGKVQVLDKELNTMLGLPGPRLPQALRGLAKIIHPELFR